ncbi:MAG: NAD-dependent epimerase/dehydratase family protein [Pseudomonadota bacterium]
MKVLVCGARGFIGRHVVAALERAGHEVLRGISARGGAPGRHALQMDFVHDTDPAIWQARLPGVQAVVNAVGLLRDSARRPMGAVHARVPQALFEACAREGVRRVVQVSALGIADNPTRYAATKREADEHLLALAEAGRLEAVVLRPSIVYGPGGASAALFDALARLPLLVLPRIVLRARVQPLLVHELAEGVARLMGPQRAWGGLLACVGPRALTLAGFIDSLRRQRGHRAARQIGLPDGLTRLSARLGDLLPFTPWGSETLALLAADNTADPAPFSTLLGRAPTDPDHFVRAFR